MMYGRYHQVKKGMLDTVFEETVRTYREYIWQGKKKEKKRRLVRKDKNSIFLIHISTESIIYLLENILDVAIYK